MNLLVNSGMNQIKDQTQNLIPKEIKEGQNSDKPEGNPENSNNEINNNPDASNSSNVSKKKKKKPKRINKQLAIKMYAVLIFHTGLLTLVEYIIRIIQNKHENIFDKDKKVIYWVIFGVSIVLALGISLLVTKISCFSSVYFIYILYVILLALDLCIFNIGGQLLLFDVFVSMLIVFDAGTLIVLLFCSLIKSAPSLFWVICSSMGGIIGGVFLTTKIYEEHKILVLIFGIYAFIIYEVMNYNVFNDDGGKKKKEEEPEKEPEVKIPPMMLLPYEFNAAFIKMFLMLFKPIYLLIKGCCCGK